MSAKLMSTLKQQDKMYEHLQEEKRKPNEIIELKCTLASKEGNAPQKIIEII